MEIIFGIIANLIYDILKTDVKDSLRLPKLYKVLSENQWKRLYKERGLNPLLEEYKTNSSMELLKDIGSKFGNVIQSNSKLALELQKILTSQDEIKDLINTGLSGIEEIKELIQQDIQPATVIQIGSININTKTIISALDLDKQFPEPDKESVCRFLEDIEKNYEKIKLFHIDEPVSLKDQYIPIQVTLERKFRHDVETFTGYLESDDVGKQAYAYRGIDCEEQQSQESWEEAKKKNKRIMVLADPGMGKSTLLKMEALSTASSEKEKLTNGNMDDVIFPILIRLDYLSKSEKEVVEDVVEYVQKEYKSSKEIIELLRKKMDDGKCLLLLDALDEVPGDRRKYLSEKLNRFARNYDCPIICTSRIVGYGAPLLSDAKEMEIVPFSQKQTEDYIRAWFRIAADHIEDETVTDEKLIRELKDKPQVQGLAQNPLLLSLICSLYQEKKITLPARRCEIYEKALDYMLDEWRQGKKYQPEGMADAKKELLEYLAYHFSDEGTEVFSRNDIRKKINDYLSSDEVSSDLEGHSASNLINELSNDDGIIPKAEREGDRYMFLHRTFQEYLTASYMKRKDGIGLAEKHFWDYDWHETLSLLAGLMDDPIPLLQEIMSKKDDIFYSMLILACRCLSECKENRHQLLTAIVEKTFKLWKNVRYPSFFNSAVTMVGRTNELMLDALIKAMDHEGRYVRGSAASALGNIGSDKAVDALIKAMEDESSYVIWRAASALGNIGTSDILERIIQVPRIDIFRSNIFTLARKLATKFSTSRAKREETLDFIPVYPELLAHKKKKS